MSNELKSIFKYLLDFAKHPEQYNDDMVALLKVEQVIELLNYIDILNNQLQQKENIRKEVREKVENFDVFKEFTFPLMKKWEEQEVKSSIDYEWNRELFNRTCEYFEELIKLKDVLNTLKYENEMLKEQLNKEG